jgi:hypothetical protein
MSAYPSSIVVFSPHLNLTEIIDAAHPNNLQNEVTAIEAALGINPQVSTSPSSSGIFIGSSTTFANLVARLANIEIGVVADAHTQYVHKTGGDTISPAPGVVGQTIEPTGPPTTDLWRIKDDTGAVRIAVNSGFELTQDGLQVIDTSDAASAVQGLSFGGSSSVGSLTTFAREDHKHSVPAIPATVIPIAFHIAGAFIVGRKAPKFIAPVNLTLSAVNYVLDSGSGATFRLSYNSGATTSATSTAASNTVKSMTLTDTVPAGSTVSIEIVAAGGSDLSVTVLAEPS